MLEPAEPPFILNSTRVLCYAETGGADAYTGRVTVSTGYANDLREIAPVPKLAVCEDLSTGRTLILYCDLDWTVLAAGFSGSVEAARALAEKAYDGIDNRWKSYRALSAEESVELEETRESMQQLARDNAINDNDENGA